MSKKILFILFVVAIVSNGCTKNEVDVTTVAAPLGEIWTTIGGVSIRFRTDVGIFAEASAGYTTSIKFLSIYRAVSFEDRRSLQIRLTADLDNLNTPVEITQNVKVAFTTFINGQKTYDGQGAAIKFKLVDKKNDIIKATFSGTLTNQTNPNDQIEIRDGSVNVQVKRF
jgi:hypothetical protein